MDSRLKNKVAIITGAASGIGAAHVRIFAANRAKVVVCDVREEEGQAVAEAVRKEGGEAVFVHLDVARAADWDAATKTAVVRFGRLTTLVNNAGIFRTEGVESEDMQGWQRVVDIDQTGVWLGMKTAIPHMIAGGGGAIVNISSLYGIIGSADSIAYHAAKGAVRAMTKAAAIEYARRGVRVNAICPGVIDTPILGNWSAEQRAQINAVTPMGRLGRPEDIAYGSLFLCSAEAGFITGVDLVIDGGWLAQ